MMGLFFMVFFEKTADIFRNHPHINHNNMLIGEADGFSTAKAAREQAEMWRDAEIGLMIESASIAPDDDVDDEFNIVVERDEETK